MTGVTTNMISALDEGPLNSRYWTAVGMLVVVSVFDFYDFFLVGFLVSVLGPEWTLTYAQISVMLISAGLGSVAGALVWGALADALGRKLLVILGILICGVSSGLIAVVPEGDWISFSLLRFFVGVGVAGASTASIAIAVEYTPTRVRTVLVSALVIPAGLGVLLASIAAGTLLPLIGWRGLALTGAFPVVLAVLSIWLLPESARWLISRGKVAQARGIIARQLKCEVELVPNDPGPVPSTPSAPASALLKDKRRFFLIVLAWFGLSAASFGVILWGPTIISMTMNISAGEAAQRFALVGLAGILGRILFSIVPHKIGRRRSGEIIGYGILVTLAGAAIFHDSFVGGIPLFLILIVVGALFYDGGYANTAPYAAEVYPVRLGARATGVGQAANGIGRIVGPLCLALIAGADDLVTPEATEDAILPGFVFLACCGATVGLAFTFLGVETHQRPVEICDEETDPSPGAVPSSASA